MSAKRMITKLALAFAAKKGMDLLHNQGGIDGLRNTLAREMGGAPTKGGGSPLSKVLEAVGLSGSGTDTDTRHASANAFDAPLGELFGALSSALGRKADAKAVNAATGSNTGMGEALDTRLSESIVRAMVQVARADGAIDDDEREALFEILGDADADERRILNDAIRDPVDAHAVAAHTPSGAQKEVYSAALLVASEMNLAEQTYLHKLRDALRLSREEQRELHRVMGRKEMAV